MKRRDGRGLAELRGKELRCGQLTKFDGSVHYNQGQTAVIVTVNGPVAARLDQEKFYEAGVEVLVSRAANVVTAGGVSRAITEEERRAVSQVDAELAAIVTECARSAIILKQYPRCLIQINVFVVSDDGSLLAVAMNAVMCALLDAAVPCRTTFAAISIRAIFSSLSAAAPTLFLMLDPTRVEELDNQQDPTVSGGYLGTFVFALPQSGGGIMASKLRRIGSSGITLTASQMTAIVTLAEQAAAVTFDFFTNCCSIQLPPAE